MPPDEDNGQGAADGVEEKVANLINATMITAIGLALGGMGVWALWRFGTALWTGGRGTGPGPDWRYLSLATLALWISFWTIRFGAGMFRSRRQ